MSQMPFDQETIEHIRSYWGGKFCGDAVGIKTLWNNASSDIDLLLSHAAHLQKLCEEQRGEIEEVCSVARGLRDKLATQTERARVMREALEKIAHDDSIGCDEGMTENWCMSVAKQALNQDSLGDGK